MTDWKGNKMTKILFKFIIWAVAINILLSSGFALGWGVMAGYDSYYSQTTKGK